LPLNLRFHFVSVHRLDGVSECGESLLLERPDARVTVTPEREQFLTKLDLASAISHCLLRGIFSQDTVRFDEERARIIDGLVEERAKRFGSQGTYIVVRAWGLVAGDPNAKWGKSGAFEFGFDVVDKDAIASKYRVLVESAMAAVLAVLPLGAQKQVSRVAEGVWFELPDGLPLFSFSPKVLGVGLSVSSRLDEKMVSEAMALAEQLSQNDDVRTPVGLFLRGVMESSDRLRAFIAGWSALEIFIQKIAASAEKGNWVQLVPSERRADAEALHAKVQAQERKIYSLHDRAQLACLKLGLKQGDFLARFGRIKREFRDKLFGSGSVADQEASLTGTRRDLRVSAMPASQRSLRASARSWTMWVPVASCQREPQRRKRTSKRFLQVASVGPLPMGRPC
jgi:hypothetical protein